MPSTTMTVTLKKPSRLNTGGRIFSKGVPTVVPNSVAKHLYTHWAENFSFDTGVAQEDPVAKALGLGPVEPEVTLDENRPAQAEDRSEAIMSAVEMLTEGDADAKPDAGELSEVLGWTVTSEDLKLATETKAETAPKGKVTYKSAKPAADPKANKAEVAKNEAKPKDEPGEGVEV